MLRRRRPIRVSWLSAASSSAVTRIDCAVPPATVPAAAETTSGTSARGGVSLPSAAGELRVGGIRLRSARARTRRASTSSPPVQFVGVLCRGSLRRARTCTPCWFTATRISRDTSRRACRWSTCSRAGRRKSKSAAALAQARAEIVGVDDGHAGWSTHRGLDRAGSKTERAPGRAADHGFERGGRVRRFGAGRPHRRGRLVLARFAWPIRSMNIWWLLANEACTADVVGGWSAARPADAASIGKPSLPSGPTPSGSTPTTRPCVSLSVIRVSFSWYSRQPRVTAITASRDSRRPSRCDTRSRRAWMVCLSRAAAQRNQAATVGEAGLEMRSTSSVSVPGDSSARPHTGLVSRYARSGVGDVEKTDRSAHICRDHLAR